MLKILFLTLLLANGVLFAYHQGQLDGLIANGREPWRLGRQLNADKMKLVSAPLPSATAASPAPPVPVATAPGGQACVEIGSFSMAEARRIEPQLTVLGGKLGRREVTESSTHMVLIPPQGSKEAAERKAEELRKLGIADFYIIQDLPDSRWGISLGVFRSEEAARTHLAALQGKGVRTARVAEHRVQLNRMLFQLRGLDAQAQAGLDTLRADLPRHEVRSCG